MVVGTTPGKQKTCAKVTFIKSGIGGDQNICCGKL